MKRMFATGAIVLLAVGTGAAQQAPKSGAAQPAGSVVQTLTGLENKWAQASKAGDGDALAPLLAADLVMIDPDGSIHTKADVVARTKKSKWETNSSADIRVMAHGDSAIVTGVWTGKGTDDTGKAVNSRERWMDTWVKMPNGSWQCVGSISTTLK